MKQRLFFLLVFLTFSFFVVAQQALTKGDSLLAALDDAKDDDKISILLELADEFVYEEEGLSYGKQAYDLAKNLKDIGAEAEALNAQGKFFIVNYEEQKSLAYFFQALAISQQLNDDEMSGRIQRNIGQAYYWLDSLSLSTQYTQQALELSEKTQNRRLEADALVDLGLLAQRQGKADTALLYMNQALEIQIQESNTLEIALVYARIGRVYFDMGDYQNSIQNHQKEVELKEELNDLMGLAIAYYNLGRIHRTVGNFQQALEQYQKSLTTFEQLNSKSFVATVSTELGLVYESLSRSILATDENKANLEKALEFHNSALKIYEAEEDRYMIAHSINNIANNYSRLVTNDYVERFGEYWEDSIVHVSSKEILLAFKDAFDYYKKALDIFEQTDETLDILRVKINLGSHYLWVREWNQAYDYLNQALGMAEQISSIQEEALAHFHLGDFYFRQAKLEKAKSHLLKSLSITTELGLKEISMYVYQKLAYVYEQEGSLAQALRNYKNFSLLKDELFSEESQKVITEMQTKYETEKKEQEIRLLSNEKALLHLENQRQRLIITIAIVGLLVILSFAGLLVNMIRQKQKANLVLKEKNELISSQKQEITDSIRYASRIQSAVLPSPTLLKQELKDHFVLFLPRDIVSGDFYWYTKIGNKMVLTAADCTGHGVPGAFMSMLGVSSLFEIVNKEGILEPAKILNKLRDFIKLTLSQTGKENEQKDGMDISLCTLDMDNMRLEWAGAYNPLVLIRNGELTEYKADKMPVAIHVNDHKSFTNHVIELQPNDKFYMFSDGFPDQFGGENGRKYMSKRFKQYLLEIYDKPMHEQKELLYQEHLNWRGELEQIDDIVIFGVGV